jgi:hypothetical protein
LHGFLTGRLLDLQVDGLGTAEDVSQIFHRCGQLVQVAVELMDFFVREKCEHD